jgi:hypothetical protein
MLKELMRLTDHGMVSRSGQTFFQSAYHVGKKIPVDPGNDYTHGFAFSGTKGGGNYIGLVVIARGQFLHSQAGGFADARMILQGT